MSDPKVKSPAELAAEAFVDTITPAWHRSAGVLPANLELNRVELAAQVAGLLVQSRSPIDVALDALPPGAPEGMSRASAESLLPIVAAGYEDALKAARILSDAHNALNSLIAAHTPKPESDTLEGGSHA